MRHARATAAGSPRRPRARTRRAPRPRSRCGRCSRRTPGAPRSSRARRSAGRRAAGRPTDGPPWCALNAALARVEDSSSRYIASSASGIWSSGCSSRISASASSSAGPTPSTVRVRRTPRRSPSARARAGGRGSGSRRPRASTPEARRRSGDRVREQPLVRELGQRLGDQVPVRDAPWPRVEVRRQGRAGGPARSSSGVAQAEPRSRARVHTASERALARQVDLAQHPEARPRRSSPRSARCARRARRRTPRPPPSSVEAERDGAPP